MVTADSLCDRAARRRFMLHIVKNLGQFKLLQSFQLPLTSFNFTLPPNVFLHAFMFANASIYDLYPSILLLSFQCQAEPDFARNVSCATALCIMHRLILNPA